MFILHVSVDESGKALFHGETSRTADGTLADATGDEVLHALREVAWYPEQMRVCGEGAYLSMRNVCMFLSDVRGETYKTGFFLHETVMRLVARFRVAAEHVAAGWYLPTLVRDISGAWQAQWRLVDALGAFENTIADALCRYASRGILEQPPTRIETPEDAWIYALRSDDARVRWTDQADLENLAARIQTWRAPVMISNAERAALAFRLAAPAWQDGVWRIVLDKLPCTRAGWMALGQASFVWTQLRYLAPGQEGALEVKLTCEEAVRFVHREKVRLEAAGYGVRLPEGLQGDFVTAEATLEETAQKAGTRHDETPIDKVTTKVTIRVNGERVNEAEIAFLLEQHSPFVFFRDHWIEVDRTILREALRVLRAQKARTHTLREATAIALGYGKLGALKVTHVHAFGRLKGLLATLTGKRAFHVLLAPKGLQGTLRDYQLTGYSFLTFLLKWGFGALLADDMGLGKTVQTIALLLARTQRTNGMRKRPSLVVAPVGVTLNWMREFARFAPGMKVHLHLGRTRLNATQFARVACKADVVVTAYSLLTKDLALFSAQPWDVMVLDEAQKIKNARARVSIAARALARNASARIALTGTPVENGPQDLWSLSEFLNPGLLGSLEDFTREVDREGAVKRLRGKTSPFLLRRLKTDPAIAATLGAKREVREYCMLTGDQRRAYEDALASYRLENAAAQGENERRGRILALLTELKQICDGAGKEERLVDLAEEIFSAGESVLVFTQYVRVGETLRSVLQERFGRCIPFLHGGLSPSQREKEISTFNTMDQPTAFVLSLRAGGFGLNLTRATHVIHYDRWWNPAVENQATDRAHRIGQAHDVLVHLFICAGTLEDRIDALLESKRALAGELVATGENLILAMNEDAREKLLALAPEDSPQ